MLSQFPHVRYLQGFVLNTQHVCVCVWFWSHVCTHLIIDVSICILIALTGAYTYVHVCNTVDIRIDKVQNSVELRSYVNMFMVPCNVAFYVCSDDSAEVAYIISY